MVSALRATTSPSILTTLSARSFSSISKPGVDGLRDQLGQAVVVAQVDEQQAAVVALAVDPPRQAHISAHVRVPEGAAGVGAIGVHCQVSRGWFWKARKGACVPADVKARG